jgi:TonB family protein
LWLEQKPAKEDAPSAPIADKPQAARTASFVPVFVKKQESAETAKATEHAATQSAKVAAPDKPKNAGVPAAASTLFKQLDAVASSQTAAEPVQVDEAEGSELEEGRSHFSKLRALGNGKKKWMILAVVGCSAVLLIIFVISLFNPWHKSMAKQSVQLAPASTTSQFNSNTPELLPADLSAQAKPSPAAEMQETTAYQPIEDDTVSDAQRMRLRRMNEQLNAPTRISRDIKNQFAENAPPPSGFSADGLGGNSVNNGVFSGNSQPVVKVGPARPLNISAGVAVGMLIQKTTPVYPTIAKSARVSGAVVLQATISKTGSITNLSVLSGPPMLRQAALDAVRTWRYKPYRLNNEPTDVETTVNVIFSLQ